MGQGNRQALTKNPRQAKRRQKAPKSGLPGGRPHNGNHPNPEGGRVEASGPDYWIAPDGKQAAEIDSSDAAAAEISTFIRQALVDESWRKAASHFGGQGLEQGTPLLTPALKQIARFRRQGDHTQAEGLEAAMCGAVWVGERAMYPSSQKCRLCGASVETLAPPLAASPTKTPAGQSGERGG